jgi:hypothetical protein
MSEFINNIRIEDGIREQLSPSLLEILTSGNEVIVSGRPLLFVPAKIELPITYFDGCPEINDEPVTVHRIFTKKLPLFGHSNIPKCFIEDEGYPAIQCFTFTEDELVIGIRESLGFAVKTLDIES